MRYSEPEFLPWDGQTVPLTLVGGYLGAGKTTAINEVLARTTRPIAVLVNDVGKINIDAKLIKKRHGDTIELTDGCVCCSLIDGFGAAFDSIREREVPPDQVLVELSGVAEPDRVRPWGRSAGFYLDGVVVLVDALHFNELISSPAAGYVRTQIAQADQLVITKRDLVSTDEADRVVHAVKALSPKTPIVAFDDAMQTAGLLSAGARDGSNAILVPEPTLFDAHTVEVTSLAGVDTEEELIIVLDGLGQSVVRAKGICEFRDGSLVLVQQVGSSRTLRPLPVSEHQKQTDLVVISVA